MIHTIEGVKKEAEILLKCKDLFTDVGFIDRIVTIAKTYADNREITKKEWIAQLEAMLKSKTQEVKELKASYNSPCDAMGHYGGSPKPGGICPKCNLDW